MLIHIKVLQLLLEMQFKVARRKKYWMIMFGIFFIV